MWFLARCIIDVTALYILISVFQPKDTVLFLVLVIAFGLIQYAEGIIDGKK